MIKEIQHIVVALIYYQPAIDCTVGVALSSIASEQTKATTKTKTKQRAGLFLDYLCTHPDEKINFYASDMFLNVHSDASYLSETRARSRVGGYYVL